MATPLVMPVIKLIPNSEISGDPNFRGLKIVHAQTNENDLQNYLGNKYQFLHQNEKYFPIRATLTRKGSPSTFRIVAYTHPSLQQFTEMVKYNPSLPPNDDYIHAGVHMAHQQTQQDFKGQKKANAENYKTYLLEGVRGERVVYNPVVCGWQAEKNFDATIFVALDEFDKNALYGVLYLPKSPIMQSDGQTQTAALFAVSRNVESKDVLENLTVALEIELNVAEKQAAQSFADRNGRGSKKNKNLVISFDTSAALSKLRYEAVYGTIFQSRIADGRTSGTSVTATEAIVDLSNMEQMLINALTNGDRKPQHFKHHHVSTLLPFAKEFVNLLQSRLSQYWPHPSPPGSDPFRKLYVVGWAFALKAIALAYFESRKQELAPIVAAMKNEDLNRDPTKSAEENFKAKLEVAKTCATTGKISFNELDNRLSKIDWLSYRKHWIEITGAKMKNGKKRTFKLKLNGEEKVAAQAQNTPTVILATKNKILSSSWSDLCAAVDEPL